MRPGGRREGERMRPGVERGLRDQVLRSGRRAGAEHHGTLRDDKADGVLLSPIREGDGDGLLDLGKAPDRDALERGDAAGDGRRGSRGRVGRRP